MSASAIARRIRSGAWIPVLDGIYRHAAAPLSPYEELMAACLYKPGAAAFRRSAAQLLGLLAPAPPLPEVVACVKNRICLPTVALVRCGSLPPEDVTTWNTVPVTTVERTLIDLATVCDRDQLTSATEDALRKRWTRLDRLAKRLDTLGAKGRKGSGVLRAVLQELDDGYVPTESELERLLRQVIDDACLPTPRRQFEVFEAGRFIGRFDFTWPERRLIVEGDSWMWHSLRPDWERDKERDAELAALGWLVLRFTWRQLVYRRGWVRETIYRAYQSRPAVGRNRVG